MRLCRLQQAYNRPTTWPRTIYMRITFSLTKLNLQEFAPGFRLNPFYTFSRSDFMWIIQQHLHHHLTQENTTFTKYVICYWFQLRLSQHFKKCFKILRHFFYVHNSCKRVVGLIYHKTMCHRPVVILSHVTKLYCVNRPTQTKIKSWKISYRKLKKIAEST